MWINWFRGNEYLKLGGIPRSGQWPTVRDKFLRDEVCKVCGRKDRLVAHHKMPFHLFPEKELDPENLIALCERKNVLNCHLIFGHFGDWTRYNINIERDTEVWQKRLK